MSLKDRILAKAQSFDPKAVGERLQEKTDLEAEPGTVAYFGELIGLADKIGVDKFCADMKAWEAKKEWYSLDLAHLHQELKAWQAGNADVANLCTALGDFLQNRFLADSMWLVIKEIERPLRRVNTLSELRDFLAQHVRSGLVVMAYNKPAPEGGFELQAGDSKVAYWLKRQPAGVSKSRIELGWSFVLDTNARISANFEKRQQELQLLKDKSNLNPAEALAGDIGNVFAPLGLMRGILFQIQAGGQVRVADTVDVKLQIPSDWFTWDNPPKVADVLQAIARLKAEAKK